MLRRLTLRFIALFARARAVPAELARDRCPSGRPLGRDALGATAGAGSDVRNHNGTEL